MPPINVALVHSPDEMWLDGSVAQGCALSLRHCGHSSTSATAAPAAAAAAAKLATRLRAAAELGTAAAVSLPLLPPPTPAPSPALALLLLLALPLALPALLLGPWVAPAGSVQFLPGLQSRQASDTSEAGAVRKGDSAAGSCTLYCSARAEKLAAGRQAGKGAAGVRVGVWQAGCRHLAAPGGAHCTPRQPSERTGLSAAVQAGRQGPPRAAAAATAGPMGRASCCLARRGGRWPLGQAYT